MGSFKSSVLCLILAAGASQAAVIKTWTYVNKTGTDANDFHIKFDRNASPPTVAPAPTNHSNSIQDPQGAARGTFPRPAASGSNPPGNLTTNMLDYTGPSAMVRNNDQLRITVPFPGQNPGRPTEVYFTLNGTRIAGRVDQVSLNENLNMNGAGLCSLDLGLDAGMPTMTASNITVWTGLTDSQLDNYASLALGPGTSLGTATITSSTPAHFDLGALDPSTCALVRYDLSYYDTDYGSVRSSPGVVYGAAVPTPGTLALAGLGLLTIRRRRGR